MDRLSLAVVAILSVALCGLEAAPEDLDAFTKKLKESSAASQSSQGHGRDVAAQFGALQSAIARGDFDRAQQMLQNLGNYGLPPELQSEWQAIADGLAVKIVEMQQQAAIDWKRAVDGVATNAKEACAGAKSSADLDEVMIEIAALQMKRVSSNNVLAQRAQQKLEGTARFVDQWARFLDYRDAGETNQANGTLRNLSQSGGGYPLLSAAEIQKMFITGAYQPNNAMDAARLALRDVKTIDQIPPAVETLKKMLETATFQNPDRGMDPDSLLVLVEADRQLKDDELSDARESIQTLDRSNLFSNLGNELKPLRDKLADRLMAAEISGIVGTPIEPGQSVDKTLEETLNRLQAESKFAEMAQIISRVAQLPRLNVRGQQTYPWSSGDALALASYASASQFDRAGDALAAINEYRLVIAVGQTGKYAPTKQAEEALARLKESDPKAFEDINGVVLEELRRIRQEVQRSMMMQRRPPY